MSQNSLVFALNKFCEDLIESHPEDAANLMANMIAAHASIRMSQALDKSKMEYESSAWISDLQDQCECLVGDAMADYSADLYTPEATSLKP